MGAAWITRDKDGIIDAGYVAAYSTPELLRGWRKDGRLPELVDLGPDHGIRLGEKLPLTARVIDTF